MKNVFFCTSFCCVEQQRHSPKKGSWTLSLSLVGHMYRMNTALSPQFKTITQDLEDCDVSNESKTFHQPAIFLLQNNSTFIVLTYST